MRKVILLLVALALLAFGGVAVASSYNEIEGTNNPDLLTGTNKADLIRGYEGSDQIFGAKNDDFLVGGKGIDRIDGGDGDDSCVGGPETKKQRQRGLEDTFFNCEDTDKD